MICTAPTASALCILAWVVHLFSTGEPPLKEGEGEIMKAGFENSGMDGQPKGYDIYKVRDVPYMWILSKAIYQFNLIRPHKLTFIDPSGAWLQPGDSFETDQGSVPKAMQIFIPKDRYLGYYLHDFICRFGYVWILFDQGKKWEKRHLTRTQADRLLRVMCEYDPNAGSFVSRWSVYIGVRVGSLFMGHLPKIPPEKPRFPIALA